MHGDLTAKIEAVCRQQSRFERDEGCCRRGADRRSGGDTGLGVEPARRVEREDRCAECIGLRDQRGVVRGQRPRESDAEQSVDDQRTAPSGRNVGDGRAARVPEGGVRCRSVGGQSVGVAAKHDGDLEEPRSQPPRNDESVATVVAGPGKHENGAATLAGDRARLLRGGATGTLHQRLVLRGEFDGAQFGRAQNRRETSAS